jgi:Domain of unknown function (DUF4410)
MKRNLRTMQAVAVSCALVCLHGAYAADKAKQPLRGYNALEVEKFENPKYETKEPMPSSWISTIQEDIVQRVIELHKFYRVMDFEDAKAGPKPDGERVIVLKGKIVEFTQGSQAARYIIGMGAGKGKIVAQCQFVDKASGEVIFDRKVDGRVIGAGQSTEGAIKGLSKELAKVIGQSW